MNKNGRGPEVDTLVFPLVLSKVVETVGISLAALTAAFDVVIRYNCDFFSFFI